MLNSAENPEFVYEINWQTGTISAPYQPVRVNNTPQRVPSSDVRPVYSPSGNFVVYNRCDSPDCSGLSSFVIYDISQQLVVTELANSISDFRLGIIPEEILSWSHDDRYLVHEAWREQGYNVIYDLNQGTYLDLGVMSEDLAKINPYVGGVKWAPDNRRIAHPVQKTSELGYDFDFGIIVIDIISKSYEIFEVPEANMPSWYGFEWAPSGDALLFADSDRDMYRLNLDDGSLDYITDHVSHIFAWYPPIQAISD